MTTAARVADPEFCRAAWRKRQMRVTPQREIIYRELHCSKIHPTAEQLHEIIKENHPNISLDTVNRTLLTMVEIGLAEVVENFGTARRYDGDLTPHDHLHCVRCGVIYDLGGKISERMEVPEKAKTKFEKVNMRIVYSGTCKKCRRSANKKLLG